MAEDGQIEITEFELSSAVLVSATQQIIDIKFQIQDLNIYQDIFTNCLSGELLVVDALNIPAKFGLHGNEFLYLNFKTPALRGFDSAFRVYKISEYNLRNLNSIGYTIHFCSEEFFINQQKRISKSYKNTTNSKIIIDILRNQLKVSDDKMKKSAIEETKGSQSLIVPNMKPLEAINWVSSFSINNALSSAFLFFETQFGFNFRSLESLYSDPVYKKITLQPKNILSDEDRRQISQSNPDRFTIKQLFDVLETASTGGFASSMLRLNIASQEHKNLNFNPITNVSKHLNEYIPFNNATNRFDQTLVSDSAYVRYFPTFQGDLTDKWLLQRACQLSLLNSFRMNIQLPGDSQICAGTILDLDYPLIQQLENSGQVEQDPYISGKYIVTSVRHRIFNNKYFCYLEVCKDSNKAGYPAYGSDSVYDKVKKS
jgi:hypothetical protein